MYYYCCVNFVSTFVSTTFPLFDNRTFGLEVDPKMQKLLEHKDIERRNVSHGIGKYILMTLVLLLALAAKRLRIRASGRHKKIELTSFGGSFSKKYRDS